jgi:hypothetical protein
MLFSAITFNIDKYRAENNMNPIFIFQKDFANDGGSVLYRGFGYQIMKWKIAQDFEAGAYLVGNEYYFWFNQNFSPSHPTIVLKEVSIEN